jgi:hypothetical protein
MQYDQFREHVRFKDYGTTREELIAQFMRFYDSDLEKATKQFNFHEEMAGRNFLVVGVTIMPTNSLGHQSIEVKLAPMDKPDSDLVYPPYGD